MTRLDKVLIKVLHNSLRVPISVISDRTGLGQEEILIVIESFNLKDLSIEENKFVLRLITALITNTEALVNDLEIPSAPMGAMDENKATFFL